MRGDSEIDDAIARLDRWLSRSGVSESKLGLMACANPRAVSRAREGSATVGTLRALLRYVSVNKV